MSYFNSKISKSILIAACFMISIPVYSQEDFVLCDSNNSESEQPIEKLKNSTYYFELGLKYKKKKEYLKALSSFKSAVHENLKEKESKKNDPARFQIYKNMVETYVFLKLINDAEFSVWKAKSDKTLSRKQCSILYLCIADKCYQSGNYVHALANYKRVLQNNPQIKNKEKIVKRISKISNSSIGQQRIRSSSEIKKELESRKNGKSGD